MTAPRILILRAPGTNCDEETAHAFQLAGGSPERVHVERLLEKPGLLHQFQILCIPGGFSYGDDVAAGRILGNHLRLHLAPECQRFRDEGKLVLGICNGFQVLMKTGLLDVEDDDGPIATLTHNDCGRFEARWVRLQATPGSCIFLSQIDQIELPVAHAEGKFVVREAQAMRSLEQAGRVVLRYEGEGYPANPNGSSGGVAGLCDETGQVFGLMPHPERFVDRTQHPQWSRRPGLRTGAGLRIFENSVRHFS